jgi:hypothetical protein
MRTWTDWESTTELLRTSTLEGGSKCSTWKIITTRKNRTPCRKTLQAQPSEKNSDTPLVCSGRTALRGEQCGVPPKSQNIWVCGRPLLDNGLLKHVSETAHTETSIARQRLSSYVYHTTRNSEYIIALVTTVNMWMLQCVHWQTLPWEWKPELLQFSVQQIPFNKVSSSPSNCGI